MVHLAVNPISVNPSTHTHASQYMSSFAPVKGRLNVLSLTYIVVEVTDAVFVTVANSTLLRFILFQRAFYVISLKLSMYVSPTVPDEVCSSEFGTKNITMSDVLPFVPVRFVISISMLILICLVDAPTTTGIPANTIASIPTPMFRLYQYQPSAYSAIR